MKMGHAIIIMNFSGAYEAQVFYKRYMDGSLVWLDLTDVQGTNGYCDREGETAIRERIRDRVWEPVRNPPEEQVRDRAEKPGPPVWSGIHFLDSGNYHYVSKLWLELADEEFDLLVLDHHTDMQSPMFGDILSCGGWIRTVLEENPLLRTVYLAGPPEGAGREAEAEYGGRVVWISEARLKDRQSIRDILKVSPLPLYLSLDKDVLNRSCSLTNWDQGEAGLEDVLACIEEAAACRRIIGADICGEDPGRAVQGGSRAADINDRANEEILCKLLEVCAILCP